MAVTHYWQNFHVDCRYQTAPAPATSAESERMSSTAVYIVNDLRKRLLSKNVEMLLFLHHNLLWLQILIENVFLFTMMNEFSNFDERIMIFWSN
jgi:hypothetical protein